MHWVDATDPEECVCGFIDSVSMLAWAAGPCMPTWWQFLTEGDLCTAFENYRRVVQLLLWKHPVEPGGFLVLKAPQIGRHLARFAEVFPEARFVITDRDPYRCIVSLAVLGHGIVEWFCEVNPLTDDGHRSKISSDQVPVQQALEANAADDELSTKVLAYLERQQAGERAAPPAALDSMGYDRADVWDDPVIRSYCDRFGIEPERTRLFGATPAS